MSCPLPFGPTLRICEENFQVTTVHQFPHKRKVLMNNCEKGAQCRIICTLTYLP